MSNEAEATDLQAPFAQLMKEAGRYFGEAETVLSSIPDRALISIQQPPDQFWSKLPAPLQKEAVGLVARLVRLAGDIVIAVKNAPLAAEADQRDVVTGTKAMRAALLLRRFRSWGTEVIHDEDRVLGVRPPGQSDDEPLHPVEARQIYGDWQARIVAVLVLVAASRGLAAPGVFATGSTLPARYRPNTAFIMMWMDRTRPELEDLSDAVKEVFSEFEIHALRADDIEHEDLITQRILNEITTAEFLFADLTGARPSVYYEVG